ncbi:Histone-lysine N-methyltransferase ASHH1 [Forsythia ovata]|uniref:Histone-lysine N-methyltransferase ASHH1 n=1 Tax=Forsythia ovata TaxID=205694 RepID=A0ABD1T3K9_9LAMI
MRLNLSKKLSLSLKSDKKLRPRHKAKLGMRLNQNQVLLQMMKLRRPRFQERQKLNEEDIAICECVYDGTNPESACGESCLNVLTITECTAGYCPCREHCRNQKFQKCEYARTKLFKTVGRGWGILADEKIKAGRFIIEYCGEIIPLEEAKQRSQDFEAQAVCHIDVKYLRQTYGSHDFSGICSQPNCETRKCIVLGETRVRIFAKKDISVGTELSYDYNFEWYGGATVRCLCGAANCSLFLGAKSHGFQVIVCLSK